MNKHSLGIMLDWSSNGAMTPEKVKEFASLIISRGPFFQNNMIDYPL